MYSVAVPKTSNGAEKLASDLITLPTHALLTERDQESIERWLRDPARA